MVDRKVRELLEFYAYGTFIREVKTKSFGKELRLDCIFNPHQENTAFQIILEDCQNIHTEIFVESFEPPGSESPYGADLIGLEIGEGDYHSRFVAHTDLFEILVLYKNIRVEEGSNLSEYN